MALLRKKGTVKKTVKKSVKNERATNGANKVVQHKKSKSRTEQSRPLKRAYSRSSKLSHFSMLIHGITGTGKTSILANFPRVKFLVDPTERGVEILAERGRIPPPLDIIVVHDYDSLLSGLESIDGCDNVVIETLYGIQTIGFDYHCLQAFDGDFSKHGYFNYQNGPRLFAQDVWPKFLALCDEVRERGINVSISAHSKPKMTTNALGRDFQKYVIYGHEDVVIKTVGWAQAVGFLGNDVDVGQDKKIKEFTKFLHFGALPHYDAKNWLGLPDVIDCSPDPDEISAELYSYLIGESGQ